MKNSKDFTSDCGLGIDSSVMKKNLDKPFCIFKINKDRKTRAGMMAILVAVLSLSALGTVWASEAETSPSSVEKEGNGEAETSLSVPIGETDDRLAEIEADYRPKKKRLIIPPYYQEKTEKYQLRMFFPFYFGKERQGEQWAKTTGVLPFYWRHRSKDLKTDCVFPFYTRVRTPKFKTDIVLQTYFKRGTQGYHFGLIPFVFFGKDLETDKSYQVVPPLFWRFSEGEKSFLLAGIFYLKQDRDDYRLGLPPILFAGREKYKTHTVVLPPLFWRFTNEIAFTTKTIVPPFFFNTREHGWSFGALPLLYLARDKDWDKTLVLPFYYGSRWPSFDKNGEKIGEGKSRYFPLLLSYYRRGPGFSQGGAAIFYHWYQKDGEYLKMYSPLVWRYGNDRVDEHSLLIPPLFYRKTSPVEKKLMISLLYWDFHQKHKERTIAVMPFFAHRWSLYKKDWRTWVFPSFDIGADDKGSKHFRLHPLFYFGKSPEKEHLVAAPIFWKFKDKEDDDLVVFPFYWRFRDLLHEDSSSIFFPIWWKFDNPRQKNRARVAFPLYWDVERGKQESRLTLGVPLFWRYALPDRKTTGVLNVFVNRGNIKGNKFWTFNLFPFLAFGHPPSPSGAYWSFLSGLVEWRRQGSSKRMKLFWIPFELGRKK
jgi:hypothetical protein